MSVIVKGPTINVSRRYSTAGPLGWVPNWAAETVPSVFTAVIVAPALGAYSVVWAVPSLVRQGVSALRDVVSRSALGDD